MHHNTRNAGDALNGLLILLTICMGGLLAVGLLVAAIVS